MPGRAGSSAGRTGPRVPGALTRALAALIRHEGGPSGREQALLLADRLRRRGIGYHPRTLWRQLTGEVSTVPRATERELLTLVGEVTGLRTRSKIEARLQEAGLDVPFEMRVSDRVALERVVRLARLWLHLHPDRTRRSLAHQLAGDLRKRGIGLRPDYLEAALGGRGRTASREVLELLLGYLAPRGFPSEAAARRAAQDPRQGVSASIAGRAFVPAARLQRLARIWQWQQGGASIRQLAAQLRTELGRRGRHPSLAHLQDLLGGKGRRVRREVLDALRDLVREALPADLGLEEALAQVAESTIIASDLEWVPSAPVVARARQWLTEHPEVSQRQLAIRAAQSVRAMGYRASHQSVQRALAGRTSSTRGYVLRALERQIDGQPASPDPEPRRPAVPLPAKEASRPPAGATDALSALLREIETAPTMTHEQEVAAAERIEAGERQILAAVLQTRLGRRELLALGDRLRDGAVALRDVIRDANDAGIDATVRHAGLQALFDDLAHRSREIDRLTRKLHAGDLSARGARDLEARLAQSHEALLASFAGARLAWSPIRAIARRIKTAAHGTDDNADLEPGLGPEALDAVCAAIVRGEHQAEQGRAELVEPYLWLAARIAQKHRGRGVPLLDLVQEGAVGLLRAAEKFDHRPGYRFPTYATWWVRSCIARAISQQGRTIRIPPSALGTLQRIITTQTQMREELDRDPTTDEIAARLDLSFERVRSLHGIPTRTASLNQPLNEEEDVALEDLIADDRTPSPAEVLAAVDLSETLREAMETLSPREQRILSRRFGIRDHEARTLQTLGDELGVSRERIRQIESRALEKLRKLSAIKRLRPYVRE